MTDKNTLEASSDFNCAASAMYQNYANYPRDRFRTTRVILSVFFQRLYKICYALYCCHSIGHVTEAFSSHVAATFRTTQLGTPAGIRLESHAPATSLH